MKGSRILVVEDESKIAEIVKAYLEKDSFEVTVAHTGGKAVSLLKEGFDLIILDLMLPDMDGEDICETIRKDSDLPIIMLTAKSDEDDRIAGLGLGADDYVVKPFSPRELVARVKALLRRAKGTKEIKSFNILNSVEVNSIFCPSTATSCFSMSIINIPPISNFPDSSIFCRLLNTAFTLATNSLGEKGLVT